MTGDATCPSRWGTIACVAVVGHAGFHLGDRGDGCTVHWNNTTAESTCPHGSGAAFCAACASARQFAEQGPAGQPEPMQADVLPLRNAAAIRSEEAIRHLLAELGLRTAEFAADKGRSLIGIMEEVDLALGALRRTCHTVLPAETEDTEIPF